MSKRICLLALLLSWSAVGLLAQQIEGVVTDDVSGKPVADVYLMLMSEDGRSMLSHSFSFKDGSFKIDLPKEDNRDDFVLTTSRLGYEAYQQRVSRTTKRVEIALKETVTQLREVKIKSTPIKQRGDTIDYFVSSFLRPQDRSLADVLARMPGIEVQGDGRVQYEGKPINRFYIENMNLLEQRYSIATKNLSPDDISTVQVYENHEPLKMLRERSDSEQAALNIKLKEGARAKWLRTFDFGVGGFPALYDATGTLARFARGNQSMFVAKGNNTGKDIFEELKMHTLRPGQVFRPGMAEGIPDQLQTLSVGSSFFMRDRARFNESAIASLNQLWRVGTDTDARLNVNYGFEREKRNRTVDTEYRLENMPSIHISDYTHQVVDWHKLENEVAITANQSKFYLEEKLTANIHWKYAVADIRSNNYSIHQKIELPRMHLKNNTSFSRLIKNVSIGLVNNTEFTRLPQSLVLTSEEDLPLFTTDRVVQDVTFSDGFSDTHFTVGYNKGWHNLDVKAGAEWVWQKTETDLSVRPEVQGGFDNSLSWNTARFYMGPSYRFNYHKWQLTASATANYMDTDYAGKRDDYFYLNPRLGVVFEPNANLRLNAGYSRSIRYGDLNQLQTGYVLKRYDLFSKGIEELQRNASELVNWGLSYKNISHFFNFYYLGTYSRIDRNLVSAQYIRDIYAFTWLEAKDNPSRFWMNRLSGTKLFTDISLTVGLELTYSLNKSIMHQQEVAIDYMSHSYAVSPSLKWNARTNLNFDYKMNAFFSGVDVNKKGVDQYIPLINHQLQTFIGITKGFSITSNLQHFYNKAPNSSVSNLLFADLGVQYAFKRMIVSLDWTNILNEKEHIASSYSAINTVTRVDKLRPSEVLVSFRFSR